MSFHWQPGAQDGAARAGVLHTAHGPVQTPVFMPVGTAGTVKAMTSDAVRATGAGIVLGNTYHLMLRPGAERVEALGGLHRFMDWPGPILTDSGGFQIMSLGALRTLDADGVTFRSHLDGSKHRLTPESAVEIQHRLDSTITMVLDECTPVSPPRATRRAPAWNCRCAGRRAAGTPSRLRDRLRAVRHRAGWRFSPIYGWPFGGSAAGDRVRWVTRSAGWRWARARPACSRPWRSWCRTLPGGPARAI